LTSAALCAFIQRLLTRELIALLTNQQFLLSTTFSDRCACFAVLLAFIALVDSSAMVPLLVTVLLSVRLYVGTADIVPLRGLFGRERCG
jgi:hypothetical protein